MLIKPKIQIIKGYSNWFRLPEGKYLYSGDRFATNCFQRFSGYFLIKESDSMGFEIWVSPTDFMNFEIKVYFNDIKDYLQKEEF
jgi:hypothetical protein